MTLLAELVSTSSRVGGTPSRLAKVREIARVVSGLSPEEIAIGVSYLAGELPQGRIGIGYAALQTAAAAAGRLRKQVSPSRRRTGAWRSWRASAAADPRRVEARR